jgi:hypothetical protein
MLSKQSLNRQCQKIGATEEKKKISYSEYRVMLGILNSQCQKIGATKEKKNISYRESRIMEGKHILNRQC